MKPVAIYSADPTKGWLPWGLLAPLLCIIFVAVPLVGVSSLLEQLQLLDSRGEPIGLKGLQAFLLFPFAMIGLVVFSWIRFVEGRSLATIGLAGSGCARAFLRGHAIGMATSFAVVSGIWMAGGLHPLGYGPALGSPTALAGIGLLLVCFVVQASAEEILFRGWLLSVVARKFNIPIAVILTSIVFSLLHYGPQQHWLTTTNTFLFSAFACSWALAAGNIWSVMGWHAGWNWLLATGFELPVTGIDAGLPALLVRLAATGPDYLTGGSQGPEGSLVCSLFFAFATAVIAWRSRGLHKNGPRAMRH